MSTYLQKGSSNMEAMAILLGVFLIMITGVSHRDSDSSPLLPDASSGGQNTSNAVTQSAPTSGSISISSGNASYAYQPYEEYISIYNSGNTSVDITGWRLQNAKDTRPYDQGGTLRRLSADSVTIPRAALLLSP